MPASLRPLPPSISCSARTKHFRGIATRYDKLARNYLAAVQLVAAIILIN
jgi:transposase